METLTGEVLDLKETRNEFGSYRDFKARFDDSLNRQAEAFVLTGYLIKRARDTDVLKESGYRDYNEFAAAEYGLDKSQVSRYIRINDRFSEGGYSERLMEQYKNFGYTKLSIMLTLPEAVNEKLTAGYSKAEINEIKAEIDEENRRTDIEVLLEEKDCRQQEYGVFGRVLYQIGLDSPAAYLGLHGAVQEGEEEAGSRKRMTAGVMDVLAPAGEGIISVRIAGEPKRMLSIQGEGVCPSVIDMRAGTEDTCTWDDFLSAIKALCMSPDGKESFRLLYGKDYPEEKPALVQPDGSERQEQKKPRRVAVSRPEETRKDGDGGQHTQTEASKEPPVDGEQKEEEQEHDENTEVAPVQPDINRQGPAQEGGRDTAPAVHDTDAPEPADTSPGTAAGDRGPEAGLADDAGPMEAPPAAGMTGQMDITWYPEAMPEQDGRPDILGGFFIALRDSLDKVYILAERGDYQGAEEMLEPVRGTIRKIRDVDQGRKG